MSIENPGEQPSQPPLRGIDLARRALEEARAAAQASGKSVGQGQDRKSVV